MTGCFSSIFSSRSSKKRQILYFEPAKPSNGEELKSGMSAATPCYCIPPVTGPVYSDLEDKPPAYTFSLAREIFRPEVLKFIEKTVDGYSDELRKLSLKIHGMLLLYGD
jgi:hypothetical protein